MAASGCAHGNARNIQSKTEDRASTCKIELTYLAMICLVLHGEMRVPRIAVCRCQSQLSGCHTWWKDRPLLVPFGTVSTTRTGYKSLQQQVRTTNTWRGEPPAYIHAVEINDNDAVNSMDEMVRVSLESGQVGRLWHSKAKRHGPEHRPCSS